jgi:predicted transcriptional regulator/transcriptional regulator with XRE-family HTH domain
MKEAPRLGAKVRTLRRRERLSQVQLAQRLDISPSYLNLIEHNRRPLSAPLLIKLAQLFQLDLMAFAGEEDQGLGSDLLEIFGDPLFDAYEMTSQDVRELAATSPMVGRAIVALYQAYLNARESASSLAIRVSDDIADVPQASLPSEEVSDLIQRHFNYFPELEEAAEDFCRRARLDINDMYRGLIGHLATAHKIEVRVEKEGAMHGVVRRYDPRARVLSLSEVLAPRSRNFQLAHQIALLENASILDRIVRDQILTTDDSRALGRVALANYFAGCVLMPYQPFLEAARTERYDIELLGHRFRTSFEQVCHRLTALQRPGAEGIPFHMVRIDIAGNISKRFSASGIRFARYSGACPRWNVHAAFFQPGMVRVQLSKMPDGTAYFCVARTVRDNAGGFHAAHALHSVGLGCEVRYAREVVYSDGVDLENLDAAVPIGTACRLCERMECEQRAFPPLHHPLQVDENVRGRSFYAPALPGTLVTSIGKNRV